MKIFVSSLISGYEPLRQAARDAVVSLGHQPVMAEDFRAQANSPQVACLQGLRSADLVVLILTDRYGPAMPGSGVSPTHEEYLEARGAKQILLFVQEGVEREPKQEELLREAQGWQGGLFREGFRDAAELRTLITRAIHGFELAHAAAPVDAAQLARDAEEMLKRDRRDGRQGGPMLKFALTTGPARQLLRPAELERDELADAIQQQAMFGNPRIFDRDGRSSRSIEGDALVLEQDGGARVSLSESGRVELWLPLERQSRRERGFGGLFSIIEESVVRELGNAISFSGWLLEHVDATQRATHVAMAAKIDAADHMGWRTQAQQDASPNSGAMRMGGAPERASVLDRPRAALRFDAARLAEDLMVPMRRQWRA